MSRPQPSLQHHTHVMTFHATLQGLSGSVLSPNFKASAAMEQLNFLCSVRIPDLFSFFFGFKIKVARSEYVVERNRESAGDCTLG